MHPHACDLLVVIVNFRTPAVVIDCLDTLLPELVDVGAKAVVVDNHSADDSVERLRRWHAERGLPQRVSIVESPRNTGFAGGNNTGIRSMSAGSYLLLNSDTLVRPGALRRLLDARDRYPGAGLISPRLEWPDGTPQESCFTFHTPTSELLGAAQTSVIDRFFSRHLVGRAVQDVPTFPEWTSFACVLVRAEVFEQIGLLDEGYFMYFEDVAFCRRARDAGWDIVNVPDARIVHLRGGSSPVKSRAREKRRLPRYFYESRTRYFYQAYGWSGLTAANLMWWAGRCVSRTRQALGRSDKSAIQRQWLDIWTNWTSPLRPYTPPPA